MVSKSHKELVNKKGSHCIGLCGHGNGTIYIGRSVEQPALILL